jgi:uncharacterized protein
MEDPSLGPPPEFQRMVDSREGGFTNKVFLKQNGLRAGWRLLVYVVIFLAMWSASIFGLGLLLHPRRGAFSFPFELLGELGSFLAAFLAAWIMSSFENRPVGVYGLPARGAFGGYFWQGCAFGIFEITALVAVIAALGGYSFGGFEEHGWEVVRWAVLWAGFFLVVGGFEEFLFRGYTLYTLTDGIGFWPAALALSVCFGAVHRWNEGESWAGVAGVFFVGLFWSFTLKRTGSLWFALGMHATFDFGETFLYSVPDSGMVYPGHLSNATLHGPTWLTGGTPGPEGSVIDFALIALFFLVFHFLYPSKPKIKADETSFPTAK